MDNAFGDAAAVPLIDACAKLAALTWLNLSGNPAIGDATFHRLAATLGGSKTSFGRLRKVKLLGTGAGGAAKKALEKACAARKVNLEC